jgi:hypothetical protein
MGGLPQLLNVVPPSNVRGVDATSNVQMHASVFLSSPRSGCVPLKEFDFTINNWSSG